MRVIPASFEIQDELDRQSLAERIEACGRICYKSEGKISTNTAAPFIKNILQHGHNSVGEMGVATLRVEFDAESLAHKFMATQPKFMQIDRPGKGEMLITGSMRGYRELFRGNPADKLVKAMVGYLGNRQKLFFDDLVPPHGWMPQTGVVIEKLSLDQVDQLPYELLFKHRFVGVKFTTNRAVTHEIVRHRTCAFLQESQRYCRYSEDKFDNQVTFIKPLFFAEDSPEYRLWEQAMVETEKLYLELLKTSSPQAARTVLPNSCKTEIIVYCNLLEWMHIFRLRTTPAAEPSMREVMIPLLKDFARRWPNIFGELSKTC
ncbi:MAG: FAD-dependent thymidylate synthase [Desulfobulbaceae bacterium]|nr:FAD-dependent thymidylate synthase [Desulfobulbaceae bacterium]